MKENGDDGNARLEWRAIYEQLIDEDRPLARKIRDHEAKAEMLYRACTVDLSYDYIPTEYTWEDLVPVEREGWIVAAAFAERDPEFWQALVTWDRLSRRAFDASPADENGLTDAAMYAALDFVRDRIEQLGFEEREG